jgi:hypothetical protein
MFALITPALQTFGADLCKPTFFGLVPWYQYLTLKAFPDCSVTSFDNANAIVGQNSPLLLVGLAILDDLIRVAALVAVGYVIYGGIQYITSQGSPDATKKAQQTIINALAGVAIAIVAAAIVSFLGSKLGR